MEPVIYLTLAAGLLARIITTVTAGDTTLICSDDRSGYDNCNKKDRSSDPHMESIHTAMYITTSSRSFFISHSDPSKFFSISEPDILIHTP